MNAPSIREQEPRVPRGELRHTNCNICSSHCPLDVYVEDGVIVQVEASKPPIGKGTVCPKAYANRQYVYHPDRIKTPLRRVGPRGEGRFEPISWEEAYAEISEKLNSFKAESGADSVAFYTGYSKWYRPFLHRLTHAFGTRNYGTESSSCFQSNYMANIVNHGTLTRPDAAHAELFIAWGSNPFHSGNYGSAPLGDIEPLREKGLKVLLIDPRVTAYSDSADIQLRVTPGTDGALAWYFANELIRRGRIDRGYIDSYVHGFEPYAAYASGFDAPRVSAITGLSVTELEAAADLLASVRRIAILAGGTGNIHHINGFQSLRAILSLSAITGNFDREGGNIPVKYTDENRNKPRVLHEEFYRENIPTGSKPKIGSKRFPLWSEIVEEYQAMDLARNILEGTPYPIRAVFAFGMNARMFPGNARLFEALSKVEFYADVDLFMTDSARYADIVLPACTSFERGELVTRMIPGGTGVRWVNPVIPPIGESRSDVDIICDLAARLDAPDPHLRRGYEHCCKYMLREVGLTFSDLASSPLTFPIPGWTPYRVGSNIRDGLATPTGKYELWSERIAKYIPEYPYTPLPEYTEPLETLAPGKSPEAYPLRMTAGGRLPGAFNSRLHRVPWARSLRGDPAIDIHPRKAKELRVVQDGWVIVETPHSSMRVRANLTQTVPEDSIFMFQSYSEADVNAIIGENHLDPYSGFPGYRSVRCSVRRDA